jgi:hypothetical protein
MLTDYGNDIVTIYYFVAVLGLVSASVSSWNIVASGSRHQISSIWNYMSSFLPEPGDIEPYRIVVRPIRIRYFHFSLVPGG